MLGASDTYINWKSTQTKQRATKQEHRAFETKLTASLQKEAEGARAGCRAALRRRGPLRSLSAGPMRPEHSSALPLHTGSHAASEPPARAPAGSRVPPPQPLVGARGARTVPTSAACGLTQPWMQQGHTSRPGPSHAAAFVAPPRSRRGRPSRRPQRAGAAPAAPGGSWSASPLEGSACGESQ